MVRKVLGGKEEQLLIGLTFYLKNSLFVCFFCFS